MKAIGLAPLKRITTQKQILQVKVEVTILFGDGVELSFFRRFKQANERKTKTANPLGFAAPSDLPDKSKHRQSENGVDDHKGPGNIEEHVGEAPSPAAAAADEDDQDAAEQRNDVAQDLPGPMSADKADDPIDDHHGPHHQERHPSDGPGEGDQQGADHDLRDPESNLMRDDREDPEDDGQDADHRHDDDHDAVGGVDAPDDEEDPHHQHRDGVPDAVQCKFHDTHVFILSIWHVPILLSFLEAGLGN